MFSPLMIKYQQWGPSSFSHAFNSACEQKHHSLVDTFIWCDCCSWINCSFGAENILWSLHNVWIKKVLIKTQQEESYAEIKYELNIQTNKQTNKINHQLWRDRHGGGNNQVCCEICLPHPRSSFVWPALLSLVHCFNTLLLYLIILRNVHRGVSVIIANGHWIR